MKTRTSIKEIYHSVARSFAYSRNYTPSHTDVRCAVNDELDSRSRDGAEVNFNYSQDAAFRFVRRVLCNIASNPEPSTKPSLAQIHHMNKRILGNFFGRL